MRKSEELLAKLQPAKTPEAVGSIRAALDAFYKAMTEHISGLERKYDQLLRYTLPREQRDLEEKKEQALGGYWSTQLRKTMAIGAAASKDLTTTVEYDTKQEYYERRGGRQIDAALARNEALQHATRDSHGMMQEYSEALPRIFEALSTDEMRLLEGASIIRRGRGSFDACIGELERFSDGAKRNRLRKNLDLNDAYRKELPNFREALKGPGEELLDLFDAYRTECRVESLCDAAQALLDSPQADSGELRSLLGELDEYRKAGRSDAEEISAALEARIRNVDVDEVYRRARRKMQSPYERECAEAADAFRGISFWKDAGELADQAQARAEQLHNDELYTKAKSYLEQNTVEFVTRSIELFEELGSWNDAKKYAQKAREQLAILKKKKLRKTATWIAAGVLFIAALFVFFKAINPAFVYRRAVEDYEAGRYTEAADAFKELGDYKDAREKYSGAIYLSGVELLDAGKTTGARQAFYDSGVDRLASGDFDGAYEAFTRAEDHDDARQKACEARYRKGEKLLEEGDVEAAEAIFMELDGHEAAKALDVTGRLNEIGYRKAVKLEEDGEHDAARSLFLSLGDYGDARQKCRDISRHLAEDAEKSGDTRRAAGLYLVAGDRKKANSLLRPFYEEGEKQLALGNRREALVAFKKARGYSDAVMRVARLRGRISAGDDASFALTEDGRILYGGKVVGEKTKDDANQKKLRKEWKEAVRIAWVKNETIPIGLMPNGTTVEMKRRINSVVIDAQRMSYSGKFVVDIIPYYGGICCLCSDGTVLSDKDTDEWTDIIEVSAGKYYLAAGLRADGTAVCSMSSNGLWSMRKTYPDYTLPDVSSWSDLIGVAALDRQGQVAGLKADGTVVCTDEALQREVSGWKDIIDISSTYSDIIGLRADGTVVATSAGGIGYGCTDWKDIVAISGGSSRVLGLKADGTVVGAGVIGWKLW